MILIAGGNPFPIPFRIGFLHAAKERILLRRTKSSVTRSLQSLLIDTCGLSNSLGVALQGSGISMGIDITGFWVTDVCYN